MTTSANVVMPLLLQPDLRCKGGYNEITTKYKICCCTTLWDIDIQLYNCLY